MIEANVEKEIEKWLPLIHTLAKKYIRIATPYSITIEDLIQEGRIAVFSALQQYDPSVGAKLITYVYYMIKKEMVQCLRRYSKSHGSTRTYPRLPDNMIGHDFTYLLEVSSSSIQKSNFLAHNAQSIIETDLLIEKLWHRCTIRQQQVLELKLIGWDHKTCAKKLQLSESRVAGIISDIQTKLRTCLDEEKENLLSDAA
jgi:RNA polymerase sigma factor (sigma-70 family)